ncbi:MAG: DUF3822 family protein [Prevotellaceae bacterium]|jgi:hypothetical protein|nr:DUF3822 family protein [Prevotellaceae bacterium]
MLNFVDRKFNSEQTSKYRLSIQISLDGFLFCIFDTNNICLAAKTLNTADAGIDYLFATELLLTKRFSSVKCIAVSQKSTLVPNGCFDKNKSAEYLEFVCDINNEKIFTHKIQKADAHCIFAIDNDIYATVKKYQPQAEFYNQCIPLIYSALRSSGKNMFIFFDSETIDIVACDSENLLLQNSYKTESTGDAIYFVAAVKKILNVEFDNIYLSGKINKHEEEEFGSFFEKVKVKVEMNKNLMFATGTENSLRLTLLEKLNRCV